MGADIELGQGYIEAKVKGTPEGCENLSRCSQCRRDREHHDGGYTRRGTTIIENAAKEPEIVDLANYLNAMGAVDPRSRNRYYPHRRASRNYTGSYIRSFRIG